VQLHLSTPGNITLSQPTRDGVGYFHFTVNSSPGLAFRVEATTNLTSWATLASLTNTSGTLNYTDTNAPTQLHRFYRVVSP
jgi:hypothetical protein